MDHRDAILIVDDNQRLLAAVQRILESDGYIVLTATDGLVALQMMRATRPNLIIADITMPRMNGYQLYERVRQNPDWMLIPFIFLTGHAMDSDIRYGKEIGVDDYLIKPIEPEDLVAVIRGKLKRVQQWSQQRTQFTALRESNQDTLIVGALCLDPAQRRAKLNGEPIALSAREFILLEYLARRAGEVVPPEALIKATHGFKADKVEAGALLRPLIRSLRRKLGYPVGELGCIETVRGWGYRLLPPSL
jgi:DNA-binding response OmpR family regulator